MSLAAQQFDRTGAGADIESASPSLGAVPRPIPFGEAIRWAKTRKVVLPEIYYGQLQGFARSKAFSIAGLSSMQQLMGVHDSLQQAMQTGATFKEWQAQVRGGAIELNLPRHRLETIFRTNIQVAYGHGRGEQQHEHAKRRPFLMYDAINDSRTRPAHKALDNFIAPINDPIWKTHTPPLGYSCRCTTISLTEEQARARGYPRPFPEGAKPDPGWDYDKLADVDESIERARRKAKEAAPRKMAEALEAKGRAADALDPAKWRPIPGTQKGSNPASQFEATDGSKFYVKFYSDANQARSEVAAARVYEQMGVETLKPFLVTIERRVGMATHWRDDLQPLKLQELEKHREDLARVFSASVLTKNWDAVGLTYDNLRITPAGRVVIVDTGASFKFRAQGKAKDYGDDIAEVRTFLDPARNAQSAAVFKPLFDADVWLEQRGMHPLEALDLGKIETEMLAVGMAPAEASALLKALQARRAALIDRYDIRNEHMPAMFQPLVDEFKKWGGARITGVNDQIEATVAELANKKFGAWINKTEGAGATDSIRRMFGKGGWSSSSNSVAGGAMKLWAHQRFGVRIVHHDGLDEARNLRVTAEHLERVGKKSGRGVEGILKLFDAEYAFHQYYLRRLHGWDGFTVDRGMAMAEADSGMRAGSFTGNAVMSGTPSQSIWNAEARVRMQTRPENVLKTWFQGARYMHFGARESEYIVLGRTVPATRVK